MFMAGRGSCMVWMFPPIEDASACLAFSLANEAKKSLKTLAFAVPGRSVPTAKMSEIKETACLRRQAACAALVSRYVLSSADRESAPESSIWLAICVFGRRLMRVSVVIRLYILPLIERQGEDRPQRKMTKPPYLLTLPSSLAESTAFGFMQWISFLATITLEMPAWAISVTAAPRRSTESQKYPVS